MVGVMLEDSGFLKNKFASDDKSMRLGEFIAEQSPILLDGAMGTELAAAGFEMGGHNCLTHPDQVFAIHKKYSEAGCDLLITNTLTMNRIYIKTHGLDVDVKAVNLAGAELAVSAAQPGQFVLGDISSTGHMLEPYGEFTEKQFFDTFREQAEYLKVGGVDGFIIETIFDLREALCAVRACQDTGTLPVIASLTFQTAENGGRTMMGNSAREIALTLADAGVSAVGVNCGEINPHETTRIVESMSGAVDLPILVQPNAGLPKLVAGHTTFSMAPGEFLQVIAACLQAGANLVGGCCGTTPEHIQYIAEFSENMKAHPTKAPV